MNGDRRPAASEHRFALGPLVGLLGGALRLTGGVGEGEYDGSRS